MNGLVFDLQRFDSGDDDISNSTNGILVNGTSGDDIIYNDGDDVTINAGAGDDSIENWGSTVTINAGTSGDDSIRNFGSNVTINGSTGDDTIINNCRDDLTPWDDDDGSNVLFKYNLGDGNDTIYGFKNNSTLEIGGGSGTYSTQISGSDIIVSVGDENITLVDAASMSMSVIASASSTYIYTDSDGDVSIDNDNDISNSTDSILVNGTSGNDSIRNFGSNVTINGSTGNDTIINNCREDLTPYEDSDGSNVLFKYNLGDGNDTIYGFKNNSTLEIGGGSGTYSTQISGSDIIVSVGDESITLVDVASMSMSVIASASSTYIYTDSDGDVSIDNDNDISNSTDSILLSGTSGNDRIYNDGDDVTIDAGAGNDRIYNSGDNVSIIGGKGNDTLTGGDGADVFVYNNGDGNDLIVDFDSDDTLRIESGILSGDVRVIGDTVIYTVGTGKISLQGAVDTPINISYDGEYITKIYSDVEYTPSSANSGSGANMGSSDREYIINTGKNSMISPTTSESSTSIIGGQSTVEDELSELTNGYLTNFPNYGEPVTDQSEIETLLASDDLNGNMSLLLENQSADFSKSTGKKSVTLSGGNNQDISFNNKGGNRAIVDADANGTKNISLGGGGDVVLVSDSNATVNIDASAGNDVIVSKDGKVSVNLNGGKTDLFVTGGRMTLENYDASTKSGFGTSYENILEALQDESIEFSDDKLELGDAKIYFGADNVLVNLFDADGNVQKVGFASDNAELDVSNERGNLILVGGNYSTLCGGTGKNFVELKGDGATVELNGNTTVTGFNDSDALKTSTENLKLRFDGKNITAKNNSSKVTIEDAANKISIVDGEETLTAYVAQDGENISVDEPADIYFGNNSGVDFSNCDENLLLDLSENFHGINKITAGKGRATIIGSDANETLTAGIGYNSIWGGAGNDKLFGKGGSSDKDGQTTFFFFAGDGQDVISGFEFLTRENRYSGLEDRINTGDSGINNAYAAGEDVVLEFDSDSHLVISEAAGKNFRVNELIGKVDKNISYDGIANCYVASGGSELSVDSGVADAEIWLDNSHETLFLGTPIRKLDASAASGNTSLVGNEYDNTIIAGHGDASLWGGFTSSNDVLIGGQSRNAFFYCNGNGNDTIQNTNNGDLVFLADISLNQISIANIADNAVSLKFTNGESLEVEGNSDVTYKLADGSTYKANHAQHVWTEG